MSNPFFFWCVRTSKHDFQLGLLITPLCSRVWIHERDTFYFEFPHSGTFFFIVARIFRQSFSFHIGILKGSSFFLGLALECWCEQPFTFPFILYCLIVSLFCVSFLKFRFSLDLEVQKASILIIWILPRCFKNGSFLVISLQAIWWTGFSNTLWSCQNFRIGFSRCWVSLFAAQAESVRLVAACSPQFNNCSFTAVFWVP